MKKFLLPFIALALMMSCSSDEKSVSEQKDSTLPKSISYVYPSLQLGTNSKGSLNYDGNKIVSILSEKSKKTFTYNGDLIVKQEEFDIDNGKEIKSSEVSYAYENQKLKTRIFREDFSQKYPDGQYIEKVIYTHSSSEIVTFIKYEVDNVTKEERKKSEGTLTYKNGNLTEEKEKFSAYTVTSLFEYDAKNNPLKNIVGFDILLNEIDGFGKNNIVKLTRTISGSATVGVYITSYVYNEKDYPVKHSSFDGGGKYIEYEIEYAY